MEDFLLCGSSLKKMNSNPNKQEIVDTQSLLISGNLDKVIKNVEAFSSDEEDPEDDSDDETEVSYAESSVTADSESVANADKILFKVFGVNILESGRKWSLC